jgi:hypothetical protein
MLTAEALAGGAHEFSASFYRADVGIAIFFVGIRTERVQRTPSSHFFPLQQYDLL